MKDGFFCFSERPAWEDVFVKKARKLIWNAPELSERDSR